DVYVFDRGANRAHRLNAPDADHPIVPVVVGQDHIYHAFIHRGVFYVMTNEGAPRYRVASAPAAQAADRTSWHDIVPEGTAAIENVAGAGDRLIVSSVENIAA